MNLASLGAYLAWGLEIWLAAIGAIVVYRMATGGIVLAGLLRLEPEMPFGIDRIQLVFVTLLFAIGYAAFALNIDQLETLPDIPTPLLLVLAGSNGAYLAVKYAKLSDVIATGKRGKPNA